jgi:phage baseplate assembly protein W
MAKAKIYSDLSFSPSLNNEGDISQVYDKDAINQSLYSIMNTRKGSRVMDPEYGCNFQSYLFDIFDVETANKIVEDVYTNFIRYEPRIIIETIDKNLDVDNLLYTFTINYRFIDKNEKGNFVVSLQKL